MQLGRRLNRTFEEINVVLLAFAIGLVVLDVTCFVMLRASAGIAWPRETRSAAVPVVFKKEPTLPTEPDETGLR
jgi:hypothetical protein